MTHHNQTEELTTSFLIFLFTVARLTTNHVLLLLVVSHDLLVHQMNVKTTFINRELEEEIYMTQSDGFVLKGQEDKVCKTFLCQSFDMKDMGDADIILNIKLIKIENRISLKQSHYVEKVLSRFSYKDSKHSPTPYDLSLIL
jgi:hypothetical protein